MNATTQKLAFDIKETASMIGVSVTSVRRLVERGLLRPSRALGKQIFSRKEIERFLEDTTAEKSLATYQIAMN